MPRDAGAGEPLAAATFRGAHSACEDFESLRFEPLPAAARELDAVVAQWESASARRTPAFRLARAQAAEAAFKQLAPGRAALHLATHGFLLGNECGPAAGTGLAAPVLRENPLVRCGLALAGANRRSRASPGEEDGILTAEEIAALDLSGVEWAVLSACETGLGELRAAEGVLGMRRAFQIAGVRTTIMSLWAVDDASASRWMRALYDARLRRGLETADAVRAAHLETLRDRRARGLGTHPFYWAGFVAAGEWR